jgi:TPR repeat protein
MWRAAALCVLSLLPIAAALAQSSPLPADERQFRFGREADLNQWRWKQTQRSRQLSEAELAVQAVTDAIVKGDCTAAAAALNAGLAKQHAEIWMLAGVMFEEGLCLKANWPRALGFYERADGAGQSGAALRLAAGYATPAAGRDLAASLWWAARAKVALPAPCAQAVPLAGEPDRFVAALKAWPAGQVEACAYSGAVISAVMGDLVDDGLAASLGLEGRVRIVFVPAQAQVELSDDLVPAGGLVADAATRDGEARAARAALQQRLRAAADRALKRHARPAAVPASWRVEAEHVLKLAR